MVDLLLLVRGPPRPGSYAGSTTRRCSGTTPPPPRPGCRKYLQTSRSARFEDRPALEGGPPVFGEGVVEAVTDTACRRGNNRCAAPMSATARGVGAAAASGVWPYLSIGVRIFEIRNAAVYFVFTSCVRSLSDRRIQVRLTMQCGEGEIAPATRRLRSGRLGVPCGEAPRRNRHIPPVDLQCDRTPYASVSVAVHRPCTASPT